MGFNFKNFFYLFLFGLSDSLSLYWIKKILFIVHPTTKKPHSSSFTLLKTFKDAFIQVIVLLLLLPALLDYIGLDIIGDIVGVVFLLLSYGYIFFYNIEVMSSTKDVALWSAKFPHTHFCEFDKKEKFSVLYSMSNLIKNFIFLILYYTPINLCLMVFTMYFPILGSILLVISESFFNATFYFLEKWPYDRFNIAFVENNFGYMLGFGLFPSIVSNILFDGLYGIASFFILSLWMMINCQLFSPPEPESISSFAELWECLTNMKKRASLSNAFNIHRSKLRTNKDYRKSLIKGMKIVRPALAITEMINKRLGKRLESKNEINETETIEKVEETTEGKLSQNNLEETTTKKSTEEEKEQFQEEEEERQEFKIEELND